MRRFALCCLLLVGCLPEVTGDWRVGGAGGCQLGNRIYVTVSDGGQHESGYFACSEGGFSVGTPSSAEHVYVSFEELDGHTLRATAHVQLTHVSADNDVGLVFFEPYSQPSGSRIAVVDAGDTTGATRAHQAHRIPRPRPDDDERIAVLLVRP